MGSAILFIFYTLVQLAMFAVIVAAILSWLIAFDVINVRNPTVRQLVAFFDRVTEPMLAPVRRFLPNLGGVDVSPIILLILLAALRILVANTIDLPLRQLLG